jgi:hypothetical protein
MLAAGLQPRQKPGDYMNQVQLEATSLKKVPVAGRDPYEQLLGKIVYCELVSGKKFASRLVAIDDDGLIFENSDGILIRNPRRRIVLLADLDRYQQVRR